MWSRYTLTPWHSPVSQVQARQRELNVLLSRFFGDREQRGDAWLSYTEGYAPHIESWVTENTLHITADLPGMEPNDVEITIERNHLTLRGERKAEQENMKANTFIGKCATAASCAP